MKIFSETPWPEFSHLGTLISPTQFMFLLDIFNKMSLKQLS